MTRIGMVGIWGLALGLTIGCGRSSDRPADEAREDDDIDISETTTVTETGCLTSAGDRFVLTALESGGGAQTELYQLIGSEDELRPHVGREVRVNGMAEAAQVADLRDSSPATPTGTAGDQTRTGEDARPEVRTESQTRLETRRMRVTSVMPTGNECGAETGR